MNNTTTKTRKVLDKNLSYRELMVFLTLFNNYSEKEENPENNIFILEMDTINEDIKKALRLFENKAKKIKLIHALKDTKNRNKVITNNGEFEFTEEGWNAVDDAIELLNDENSGIVIPELFMEDIDWSIVSNKEKFAFGKYFKSNQVNDDKEEAN
jgi:hypothetical protein